jgi:hypothetical protein
MYRISVGDYTYIGSTMDFKQRKNAHKKRCCNPNMIDYNEKKYQMIREAGGWDKCEMVPIEEFECETTLDARIREEHWRREYNANMNSRRAHVTEEQRITHLKELAKKRNSVSYVCECGGRFIYNTKCAHQKTQKHIKYLEEQKSQSIITTNGTR